MSERHWMAGPLAAATIVALVAAWLPTHAEPAPAGITGVIRSADRAPLAGVRLLAADPGSGRVHRSEPTSGEGSFTLSGLTPGRYDLAVETDKGLYLVKDPLYLVAGVQRTVQIAVGEGPPTAAEQGASQPAPGIWNSPFAAGALVLGFAIVIGILVKEATDDELNSTQN